MSNVKINGTTYADVNKIKLPLSSNESEYTVFDNVSSSIIDGSISGAYENNDIVKTRSHCFYNCNKLTSLSMGSVTEIATYSFQNCTGLTEINLPKVKTIRGAVFLGCTGLTEINLPMLSTVDLQAFANCTALKKVDMLGSSDNGMARINIQAFSGCSALETLIIRSTSFATGLNNDNALANTPIASGTGYVYVPNALLEVYKEEPSWATYKEQLRAIEDYPDICG